MPHVIPYGSGHGTPRYARSASPSEGPARGQPSDLTFEEWLQLFSIPDALMPMVLRNRATIESFMPTYSGLIRKKAHKLQKKGLRVPERFLRQEEPTREEVVQFARGLFRKVFGDS